MAFYRCVDVAIDKKGTMMPLLIREAQGSYPTGYKKTDIKFAGIDTIADGTTRVYLQLIDGKIIYVDGQVSESNIKEVS